MVVLFPGASPQAAEAPPRWTSCHHYWFGWDGSVWDLSHGLSGLKLLAGARGMRMPPINRQATTSPAVPGSIWRASPTDERAVLWRLKVFGGDGSTEWIRHNSAFWRTLHPERSGVWMVVWPDGTKRSLTCRYAGLGDDTDEVDPALIGRGYYDIQLVADTDPYWRGEPIVRTFTNGGGENYYGGSGGGGFGPPFYISPSNTTDTAAITNDGDVDAWPVWTVHGPTTSVSVGVGARAVTFPVTLTSGQWIRLDTKPTDQVPIDHAGADRTSSLGSVDFASIPSGANVDLNITITGTGSVDVQVVPGHLQALA